MSTSTIAKDEDLIILNSDSENDDLFNFGETLVSQAPTQEDTADVIIDFGTNEVLETKTEAISNNNSDSGLVSDFDFSFDFSEQKEQEATQKETVLEQKEQEIVSFSDENTATQDLPKEVSFTDFSENTMHKEEKNYQNDIDLGDVNAILDQTISKLNSRKDVISAQRTSKTGKIQDLEAQIKKLQAEVGSFMSDIEDLDIELKKIDKNISSIEKMKNDTSEITTERQRQHNLGNIKKTK